jgi:WD40 repeat protein
LNDGRLISGSKDGSLKIWNIEKIGNCEVTLKMHSSEIITCIVLEDGRVMSGSKDKVIICI